MSATATFDPTSVDDVHAIRAQQYVAIAGFCLMLYDIVITLDIEINLVWRAPMSVVKFLFLWNRYVTPCLYIFVVCTMSGLLNTPANPNYCVEFFLIMLTSQAISVNGVGAALMLLRVHALYNRSKGVLILLSTLLALELVSSVGVMAYGVMTVQTGMSFNEAVHACISTHHLRWLWVVFLFMMLYDCVIFFLVFHKTWSHAKTLKTMHAYPQLVGVLLFDAVGYFLVMMAAELVNIIAYTTFPPNIFLIGINIMWCMNTTMISRLYLNLRSAARPQDWSSLTAFKSDDPSTYTTDDSGWTLYGSE
ncbi:hypothetical protein CALCODRAFT_504260 [Calocera cornea HHB12733]|uniref:DUF6533 domain-containing protein n=1 Tax=Calocera cornea HHB12733 TaxID=1353952 RepID=A0A165CI25_9BASI|nr:hypothetical protein CALCODRAFT_504260 [Calocera cornea HHB12733]